VLDAKLATNAWEAKTLGAFAELNTKLGQVDGEIYEQPGVVLFPKSDTWNVPAV
jgi:hypothetical protein